MPSVSGKSIKFPTQYSHPSTRYSQEGSPIRKTYVSRFASTGALELVESGEENLYDFIQSFALSTDIYYILDRFTAGDTSVLQQRQGLYFDATQMPTTLAESLNLVNEGQHAFDTLPVEVKQRFNNSFSEWLASFNTDEWKSKMGQLSSEPGPSPIPVPDPVSAPDPSAQGGVSNDA